MILKDILLSSYFISFTSIIRIYQNLIFNLSIPKTIFPIPCAYIYLYKKVTNSELLVK